MTGRDGKVIPKARRKETINLNSGHEEDYILLLASSSLDEHKP